MKVTCNRSSARATSRKQRRKNACTRGATRANKASNAARFPAAYACIKSSSVTEPPWRYVRARHRVTANRLSPEHRATARENRDGDPGRPGLARDAQLLVRAVHQPFGLLVALGGDGPLEVGAKDLHGQEHAPPHARSLATPVRA